MEFKTGMIAPCGINCGTCLAFLRAKNRCGGCLSASSVKALHCQKCLIKNCEEHENASFTYCSSCGKFPCKRMKHIDKRYGDGYALSLIGNLVAIKENGIDDFLKNENAKWICKSCGAVLCVHRKACQTCGKEYR